MSWWRGMLRGCVYAEDENESFVQTQPLATQSRKHSIAHTTSLCFTQSLHRQDAQLLPFRPRLRPLSWHRPSTIAMACNPMHTSRHTRESFKLARVGKHKLASAFCSVVLALRLMSTALGFPLMMVPSSKTNLRSWTRLGLLLRTPCLLLVLRSCNTLRPPRMILVPSIQVSTRPLRRSRLGTGLITLRHRRPLRMPCVDPPLRTNVKLHLMRCPGPQTLARLST